jgi:plastocyanin
MDRRRYLWSVAATGTLAAIAGCTDDSGNGDGNGGNGGNGDADSPTPTERDETPTDGDGDDGTPTAEPGGETATPPPDPDQRVSVVDNEFDPADFEISVGDTVLWEWVDSGHNVSYDAGQVPDGTDWTGDDEDIYSEGHVHFFTFETPGEYDYHCVPHRSLGMEGRFTVTE